MLPALLLALASAIRHDELSGDVLSAAACAEGAPRRAPRRAPTERLADCLPRVYPTDVFVDADVFKALVTCYPSRAITQEREDILAMVDFDARTGGSYELWKRVEKLVTEQIGEHGDEKWLCDESSYFAKLDRQIKYLKNVRDVVKLMKDLKKVEAGGAIGVSGVNPAAWRVKLAELRRSVGVGGPRTTESVQHFLEKLEELKKLHEATGSGGRPSDGTPSGGRPLATIQEEGAEDAQVSPPEGRP